MSADAGGRVRVDEFRDAADVVDVRDLFLVRAFSGGGEPFIRLLPLTPLIDALCAVMLDGAALSSLTLELAIMTIWTVLSFALALRWFRWT